MVASHIQCVVGGGTAGWFRPLARCMTGKRTARKSLDQGLPVPASMIPAFRYAGTPSARRFRATVMREIPYVWATRCDLPRVLWTT